MTGTGRGWARCGHVAGGEDRAVYHLLKSGANPATGIIRHGPAPRESNPRFGGSAGRVTDSASGRHAAAGSASGSVPSGSATRIFHASPTRASARMT